MLARTTTLAALFTGMVLCSPPVSAEAVWLTSSDGERLYADYNASSSAQGVVFVHMEKRKSSDWRFLAERLQKSNFHTLAIDLRGHGASVPEDAEKPILEDADYMAMTYDVEAAVAYLKSQGATEVSLVGASLGANLALLAAGRDPTIENVVMLSPGLKVKGVPSEEAMKSYGERPVLIAVSDADSYSAKSALVLDADAKGSHRLEVLKSAGKGTKMLNSSPTLEPLIQSWLMGNHQTVGPSEGGLQVQTGDTTAVETTGQTMDELR